MNITPITQSRILVAARSLIGRSYKSLDCSHFVHEAYHRAGLEYPYRDTSSFSQLASGPEARFMLVHGADQKQPADVVLMTGHMGLWDPQGCTVLMTNRECLRFGGKAPFLSSRSGGNRGPDFGRTDWWSVNFQVFRWNSL